MARSHTAPAWRRAFLRELGRSGSVALAAAKVGIDRSSAYQARRRNPAFAASWERALVDARARLVEGEPGEAVRLRDDECVRASKGGRPCVVRAGPGRWSVAGERAFLGELAMTANVKAAARAAGVSTVAVYNRRRKWPAFAAAWREAKAEGWERLEWLLIQAANATLDPEPEAAVAEGPAMSVGEAMKLWFHHTGPASQGGRSPRHGWRRQEPDIEEVRAEILRKVAAIKAARERRAQSAAEQAG